MYIRLGFFLINCSLRSLSVALLKTLKACMKSTTTVRIHLRQHMCSECKRQHGRFFCSLCVLLTRSFLQTGSEWQGGTELPQSTGSHGSKQTGMANTNTNTTVSLHWNVGAPAQKLACVRNSGIIQTHKQTRCMTLSEPQCGVRCYTCQKQRKK